jgi:hypothetical protein
MTGAQEATDCPYCGHDRVTEQLSFFERLQFRKIVVRCFKCRLCARWFYLP